MAGPIYKHWVGRAKEAYYELPQEKQDSLMANVNEAIEKVGGKRVVLCFSGWSSEEWPYFGVDEFPNIEAVQKFAEAYNELNVGRYQESKTILGTKWEP